MRNLRHWIAAALAAQPSTLKKIELVQLMFQTWFPQLAHFELSRVNE